MRKERKTLKTFAENSTQTAQFGTAVAGTDVLSKDPDTIQALPTWEQGWSPALVTGARLPTFNEMEGVQYVHSYQVSYLLERGIPEYDSGTNYDTGALCTAPNSVRLYKSLVDDNLGESLSDPTKWRLVCDFDTVQPLSNFTATANPTVNDDADDGYVAGSIWYNTSTGDSFLCTDNTVGAAVWVATSISIGDLGSAAFENVGTDIGELPQLVDVGGGQSGLPVIDGSNLTNVNADGDNVVIDDSTFTAIQGTDAQAAIASADSVFAKAHRDSSNPTASDDDTQGFKGGSVWINETTNRSFICIDSTTCAAVWRDVTNNLNNYSATVDPVATNDETEGYSQGSIWFNTTSTESFLCTDPTEDAAVWIQTSIDVLDLGGAAFLDAGTNVGDVVQLIDDSGAKLPAIDGSKLTGLSAGQVAYNNTTGIPSTLVQGAIDWIKSVIDGLGSLATKNTVSTSDIDNEAVTLEKVDDEVLEAANHTALDPNDTGATNVQGQLDHYGERIDEIHNGDVKEVLKTKTVNKAATSTSLTWSGADFPSGKIVQIVLRFRAVQQTNNTPFQLLINGLTSGYSTTSWRCTSGTSTNITGDGTYIHLGMNANEYIHGSVVIDTVGQGGSVGSVGVTSSLSSTTGTVSMSAGGIALGADITSFTVSVPASSMTSGLIGATFYYYEE